MTLLNLEKTSWTLIVHLWLNALAVADHATVLELTRYETMFIMLH
jgi:hypothetical protein